VNNLESLLGDEPPWVAKASGMLAAVTGVNVDGPNLLKSGRARHLCGP